jgi:hypothetical protein
LPLVPEAAEEPDGRDTSVSGGRDAPSSPSSAQSTTRLLCRIKAKLLFERATPQTLRSRSPVARLPCRLRGINSLAGLGSSFGCQSCRIHGCFHGFFHGPLGGHHIFNHPGSSELPVLLLSDLLIPGPSQCVDEPQQASYKASPRNQRPHTSPESLLGIGAHNPSNGAGQNCVVHARISAITCAIHASRHTPIYFRQVD